MKINIAQRKVVYPFLDKRREMFRQSLLLANLTGMGGWGGGGRRNNKVDS